MIEQYAVNPFLALSLNHMSKVFGLKSESYEAHFNTFTESFKL